jgi:methionine aminotransferase
LTTEFGVAAIPVSSFFSNGKDEKVIRLCFAKTEDLLAKAGAALEKV